MVGHIEFVTNPERDHEELILRALIEVCQLQHSTRGVLLEQLADLLVKHNNPPRLVVEEAA
jgi:hypothetical protein